MYNISTKIELPIAHCLYKGAYSGLCCGNVYRDMKDDGTKERYDLNDKVFPIQHGHNYIVTVTIEADENNINKEGMLIDFKLFKKVLHSQLDKYDHSNIFTLGNPLLNAYKNNFKENNVNLIRSRIFAWGDNENPTAELMAKRWCFEILNKLNLFGMKNINLKVSVEETSNNYCSYEQDSTEDKVSGVYKIANNKTGNYYIGYSYNIKNAWRYIFEGKYQYFDEGDPLPDIIKEDLKNYPNILDWDLSILEETSCVIKDLQDTYNKWIEFYK